MSSQNNSIFGNTTVLLQGSPEVIRAEETNLGNLTADAILAAAKNFDDSVVVSLARSGNFFSSIDAGNISQSDIEKALALNSNLTLATVTAQELRDLLEFGVANTAEGETPDRFPQVAGLEFTFDPNQTAIEFDRDGNVITQGQRIRSLTIVNAAGETVDQLVENGEILGQSDREIRLVTPQSLIEPALSTLEPEVFFSVDNPVISFVEDRGLIVQDLNLGTGELITLFDLDVDLDTIDDNVDILAGTASIQDVNLLVSPEISNLLTDSDILAGRDVGDLQIDASFTIDGTNVIVNGGTTSVNLDVDLLATLGFEVSTTIDTVEAADGFSLGLPIVTDVIDTEPFIFDFLNPIASNINGTIDHTARIILESSGSGSFGDFDPEIFVSVVNPVISFVADRGFILQDSDLGTGELFTLFDISIAGDVTIGGETLTIAGADLLISRELAEYFGNSNLEGIHIGNAQIDGTLTPDGDNFILNGGITSANLDLDFLESLGLSLANTIDLGTAAEGFAVGFPIIGAEDADPFIFNGQNGLTPVSGDIDHQGRVIFAPNSLAPTADVYPFNSFAENVVDLQDALQISLDNPIINFITDRGFVLQDTDSGTDNIVTLFDLDIQGDVNVDENNNTLGISNVDLLVSPELAEILGDSALTGTDLGDAQVDGTLTPDGNNFAVNGGVTSVNLNLNLIGSLGLSLFSINATGTPANGFAIGFPIVGEVDEDPFVFSTENGLTPISGDIDHNGRVVLEPSGNANFAGAGSEQDALAEYLSANFPDADQPFDTSDTPADDDTRIQSISSFVDIDITDQVGPFDFSSDTNNLRIIAGNRDDDITSGPGNDIINAGGGNNTVNAGPGDDEIIGSGQSGTNNQFDGGEGTDVVTYDGIRDNFSVARFPNDIVRVGSNTDTLRNVEQIQFTDETISVREDLPIVTLEDTLIRFRNDNIATGTYIFAGAEEAVSIRRDFSPPFLEEGNAFNVSLEANEALVRFNRFRNNNIFGTYIFANEEESVSIRENFSDAFTEEGIAFYTYGANYGVGQDVIRFRNVENSTYIFALPEEAQSIRENFSEVFAEEGVAFEV